MGLPLTPSTTYVANSTPVIKAQDLNDLQKYLAGMYSATYSVKALVVDGTGGNATTGTPGAVRVSSTVSAFTTTPPFAMPTVPIGELNREQCLLGAVRCHIDFVTGNIFSAGGFNVASVVRSGLGQFVVTFNNAFPNANRHVPQVSTRTFSGPHVIATIGIDTVVAGKYVVPIIFWEIATNLLKDPDGFYLVVVGG